MAEPSFCTGPCHRAPGVFLKSPNHVRFCSPFLTHHAQKHVPSPSSPPLLMAAAFLTVPARVCRGVLSWEHHCDSSGDGRWGCSPILPNLPRHREGSLLVVGKSYMHWRFLKGPQRLSWHGLSAPVDGGKEA